jgi:PqqD family protein of HPr-rel-A system
MLNSNIAISDTGLVFNPATGESFTVNEIGLEILRLVKENKSKDEICKTIQEVYETDQTTAERDINDFLNSLVRNQILSADK